MEEYGYLQVIIASTYEGLMELIIELTLIRNREIVYLFINFIFVLLFNKGLKSNNFNTPFSRFFNGDGIANAI